jgi:hypothetical protein
MRGGIGRRVMVVVAAVALMCGCGGNPSVKDEVLARSLLDAIYNGSMAPVQDSMDPMMVRAMADWVTAGTGQLLRDTFGDVRSLEFDSVEKGGGGEKGVWNVSAARGSFQMKIWFYEGKVSGFSFRPSSGQEWGDVPQIGVDYSKRGKKPAGW